MNALNNFNPLVTCIIPVYNAQKYLKQGVESLVNQTYKNIEIILVDDRSTDKSWEICQELAVKYPLVRIFRNKKNSGGPFRGRVKGVQEAQGEWITFMDCDDYVKATYIENLIKATNKGAFDIAVTGHSRLYSDGRLEDFIWNDYSQTTAERLASFYHHFLRDDFWTDPTDTSGQNLIRAEICKNIDFTQFSDKVYAEDTLMALLFIANSKNGINFIDNHDFIWRQVEGSGSHGGFSDRANKEEFFKACFDIFHQKNTYSKVSSYSPLISVIIPVYNVEKYLESCLESVINQTYKNLEIIIVNDGSTDLSQSIIDKYSRQDARVKLFTQKNKGLNMARAAGSKVAKGEYVTFVDSDDEVHEDYVKYLYEVLVKNNVDISACGFHNFTHENEIEDKRYNCDVINPQKIFKDKKSSLEYFLMQLEGVPNVHQMTAWGKLYKVDFIDSTDWNISNYRRHEDNLETLQWYNKATRGVAVISAGLYYYRVNPDSITQTSKMNVNPEGEEINYFQFLLELYKKIKLIINDTTFERSILNYFAHLNSIQLQNYFSQNKLTIKDMEDAAKNQQVILSTYNEILNSKDQSLHYQQELINDIYNSDSWKLTKPLRNTKERLRKIKKRLK